VVTLPLPTMSSPQFARREDVRWPARPTPAPKWAGGPQSNLPWRSSAGWMPSSRMPESSTTIPSRTGRRNASKHCCATTLAAFHVVRPGFAVMRDAGYGRLVFVSSAAGVFGQPGLLGYATAKTGMLGLMNVAALEGAAYGIKANAVMPMGDTRMAAALMGEASENLDARAFLETLRLDQVAPVVAYLASEHCTQTHQVFSAFRGRVAALQIGVTHGWFSTDGALTAEEVAANLEQILDASGILLPGSIFDEIEHAVTATSSVTDADS
jgi:Enoyl-(Acyl carrier protein) reductase